MKRVLITLFLLGAVMGLFAQDQQTQKIYLTNGKVLEGIIVQQNSNQLVVKTEFGQIIIEKSKIANIEFKKSALQPQQFNNQNNDVSIGKAFLYESRKKKISTAIGFQALGAGLLYAEKYGLGSVMMILENGLIIGGAFADAGSGRTALWVIGLLLKSINTFLTIKAVNDYNNKLAVEMGLKQQEIKEKIFLEPGNAIYLEGGGKGALGLNFELRLNRSNLINPSLGIYDAYGIKLVPSISFVHLFGKKFHKFELGIGVGSFPLPREKERYVENSFGEKYQDGWENYTERFFEMHAIIGYRYQKKNGLIFRIGFTPMLIDHFFPLPHISFGYSW